MGNYRQHMTFASSLGVVYALGTTALGGMHWVYGSVAALLTTIGGLLPDLDHPIGVELKGFTGILGVLTAVAVWHRLARGVPGLPFELHMWAAVLAYIFVRHGMRRTMARMMVHRGIMHSFPTCAVWGAAAYLYYPTDTHLIRIMMASAVILGFLSHLLLDEMFSVDLNNARIKRSFGTALKFWAPSLPATLAMYALLSALSYHVIQNWPDATFRQILAEPVPPIRVPWPPDGTKTPNEPPLPGALGRGRRLNWADIPARRRSTDGARRANYVPDETSGPSR
jgi:membrane-bound metal-dependent hydrolase YbcI (DUF457 family)